MTIYEAIAKIQDEVEVRKEASNPFFHSKYATYEGVLNAIHSAMRKYGLVAFHTFEPSTKDGYITVITNLCNTTESTRFIESKLEIPLLKNDPQSAGSAITYAKRYSLLAILGLGTEDDDGNSSSGKVSDPRVPDEIKNTVFATDKQVTAINQMIKAGQLKPEIAKEIPSMSTTRASQLISSVWGGK